MGLLDDAIREHLDLKRRRGADPTEVERAEREALGPVRRGPEPEQDEAVAGVDPAYDADEQDWEEPLRDEPGGFAAPAEEGHYSPSEMFERAAPPPTEEPPLAEEPPLTEEPPLADGPPTPRFAAPAEEPHDFFAEDPLGDPFAEDDHPGTPPPHAAPAPPEPRSGEPAGDETVEYRIDEALEAEPKKEGEDVLEETPEFLQDTPDHDRLWFEQRPPKDFDFEG
jgi:hypothetical protein